MLTVVWFSTGRDEAARQLLVNTMRETLFGELKGLVLIVKVFCNQDRGEHCETDKFLDLVESIGIPLVCFSSAKFRHEYQGTDWHEAYNREVMKLLEQRR